MSIVFGDANSLSMGLYFYKSTALCPHHGEVGGDFHVFVTSEPTYTTGKICPKCFVDWVHAHVNAVQPCHSPAARITALLPPETPEPAE